MRLMEHANRFGMPILTFIDTPELRLVIAEHQVKGKRLQSPRDVPAGCSIICTVIGRVALVPLA